MLVPAWDFNLDGRYAARLSALRGHDSNAPIDVSSDRIEVQDRTDRAIFAGNVIVRQGTLTLRTARLTLAYASEDGIDINRIDDAVTTIVEQFRLLASEPVPADELEKVR